MLQVLCKLCPGPTASKTVKLQKGSSNNVFQHIKKHHPNTDLVISNASSGRQQSLSAKAGHRKSSTPTQLAIKGMFVSLQKYIKTDNKHQTITKAITSFLCDTITPIHIVDQPSWERLLNTLEPRYECPSHNFFAYTAIPKLYAELRNRLLTELGHASHHALTMDAWSSITTAPFPVITVHFITGSLELCFRVLQCVYLLEDHTGINISARVDEVLEDFGLEKSRVVSITTNAVPVNRVGRDRGYKTYGL